MIINNSAPGRSGAVAGLDFPPAPKAETAFVAWIRRHSLGTFFVLVLIGSLRIASTYTVFSHTWDEPDHIATGTQWLSEGTQQLDYSHPPLARIAAALGIYLTDGGAGLPKSYDTALAKRWDLASATGLAILNRNGAYERNLALARLGMLPFFWIASLTVYLWTRRYLGEPAAAFATFFFTFLPAILAHAGLATTDMALTAFTGASFLTTLIWLEMPVTPRSLFLGTIAGLAGLSKFSALPYIPVALLAAFIWYIFAERPTLKPGAVARKYLAPAVVAALTCLFVVWAGYRFTFGPVTVPTLHLRLLLPAPELFGGLLSLARYNKYGHLSFLMGQHSQSGWWYFFPVVLAVKTPIPFLALTVFGAIATARRTRGVRLALAFSLGILLFTLASHLNFGVRHILVVYIGFSIVAAAGAARLLELSHSVRWAGWVLAALVTWMTATSVLSHPDYLPYFNALAGGAPEKILVDSDLDWGQDLKRLSARLREAGAASVTFSPNDPVDFRALGFPPVFPAKETGPAPGWNATSLTSLKLSEGQGAFRNALPWEETAEPKERIGKGIWLWYFPLKTVAAR